MTMTCTQRQLCELDIGGTFRLTADGMQHPLLDTMSVGKYQNNIWAYGDPDTMEFQDLSKTGKIRDQHRSSSTSRTAHNGIDDGT